MNLTTQWLTMSMMFVSGLGLGIILDFYQILKERFRLRGWVVSLIDLLYWFVSAGLVFSILMWSNWGELRFYIFLSIILGVFLYYQWLHRPADSLIRMFIRVVEYVLQFLFRLWNLLIWNPILWIYQQIQRILQSIGKMLIWIGRGIIFPLEWLTRPVRNWLRPYKNRVKKRLQAWKKLIKKGDSE